MTARLCGRTIALGWRGVRHDPAPRREDQGPPAEFGEAEVLRSGRVGSRRAAPVAGGGSSCCRRLSPRCRCLGRYLDHGSSPRSANPARSIPALGSRSRPCLRPRVVGGPPLQALEPHGLPKWLVRVAHGLPCTHLVRPAEPLARPFRAALLRNRFGTTLAPAGHPKNALASMPSTHSRNQSTLEFP